MSRERVDASTSEPAAPAATHGGDWARGAGIGQPGAAPPGGGDVAYQAWLDARNADQGGAVQLSSDERQAARDHEVGDLALEQIAHRLAYQDGGPGSLRMLLGPPARRTPTGAALDRMGFDCDRLIYFSGAADLQYWALPAKDGADVTPVIAFRGTQTDADRADDTNRMGVGMGQFLRNQGRIQQDLARLGGRGVVATGHSLGGAIAQIAACFFPDRIVDVVTFQSPGISADVLARLRSHPGEVTAHHHRTYGDSVDDAGEAFIPGDVTEHGLGGRNSPGNPVAAHLSYPARSSAAPGERESWMEGNAYAGLAPERDSTTDDPGFGRPLAPHVETARRNPGGTGSLLGSILGPIGSWAGGAAGNRVRGEVGQSEAYGPIWLEVLARAEAADTAPWQIESRLIDAACRRARIANLAGEMRSNFHAMFPEYAVLASVIVQDAHHLDSADALVGAVREVRDSNLPPAALDRVRRIYPVVRADPPR